MKSDGRGLPGWARRTCLLFGLLSLTFCQSKTTAIETGGETHFLKSCSPGDDVCGEHLSCVCGACTVVCDDADACAAFPGATCVDPSTYQCGIKPGERRCDVVCEGDGDCAVVSPFHVCLEGICRTVSPPVVPASSTEDAGQATQESSTPDATPSTTTEVLESKDAAPVCTRGDVGPNEVLVMGDAFFGLTHEFTAFLEELARNAGSLAEGSRYRDGSRPVVNVLGNDQVLEQYLTASADSPVSIVVMTGGGADVLGAMCDAPFDGCQTLLDARGGAERLLAAMAEGGVSHVLYVFYPNPQNPDLQAKMDFLRPLLQAECAEAAVDCQWIDLRPRFEGNYASYIGPDGLVPTTQGSRAAAEVVWGIMQSQCIAQ